MITLQIDEQACVSCTLCVDACPTHVFEFDDAAALPRVKRPAGCFGCLACTQVCPAEAILHEGVVHAQDFYHDPYALEMVTKLTAPPGTPPPSVDPEALGHGLEDLKVRLLFLGAVLKETMGAGLPAVGSLAGKTLAAQLPRHQVPSSTQEALALAQRTFAPTWDIHPILEGDTLKIEVGGCFIRDLCAQEKLDLGGELCQLFCSYLVGYLGKMTHLRLRTGPASRDWKGCTYETRIYA